jgi:hypothetical protein
LRKYETIALEEILNTFAVLSYWCCIKCALLLRIRGKGGTLAGVRIGQLHPRPGSDFAARFLLTDKPVGPPYAMGLPWEAAEVEAQALVQLKIEFEPFARDGRPERITRVALQPLAAMSAADFRQLPWSRLIRAAEALVAAQQRNTPEAWREFSAEADNATRDTSKPTYRRRGRRPHSHAHYYAIAQRYQQLCQAGDVAPVAHLAEEHNVNRSTAASWVKRSRALGFLGPARKGKAG